jgi:hypothetical protein
MAEKFSVKHEGKEIWVGMAMTEDEAIACAGLDNKDIPKEEMTAEIVPFTDARLSDGGVGTAPIKTRKPRADIGQPRKAKAESPKSAKAPKGRRYLVAENVKICNSRAELEDYLLTAGTGVRIFNYTHELKAKSQFKLETV